MRRLLRSTLDLAFVELSSSEVVVCSFRLPTCQELLEQFKLFLISIFVGWFCIILVLATNRFCYCSLILSFVVYLNS